MTVIARCCLVVATLLPMTAVADSFDWNRDCPGTGAIDFHRKPVVRWACFEGGMKGTVEYSNLSKLCDSINETLGAKLVCEIDHKGLDVHYDAEANKPKARDRDVFSPMDYCSSSSGAYGWFMGNVAMSPPVLSTIANTPAIKKAFLTKVKKISCVYDDKQAPSVGLKNGTLTFYVKTKGNSDGIAGTSEIEVGIRKLFPEYEKLWQENH